MQTKRVLAVDPGFDRVGLAVLDTGKNQPALLFSGCFKTDTKRDRPKRLLAIGEKIQAIIRRWRPKTVAVETLFFNTNTTSVIGVAEARGVIVYEAMRAGLEVFEYGPQTVKLAVTGYGKASKEQVATMVEKLLNLPKEKAKKLDDETDAIALGITHLATKKGI